MLTLPDVQRILTGAVLAGDGLRCPVRRDGDRVVPEPRTSGRLG
jgi:hypothetical protein